MDEPVLIQHPFQFNEEYMTKSAVAAILFCMMSLIALAQTPAKSDSKPPAKKDAKTTMSNDLDARRKQLNDLLDEQWQYNMRISPEFASIIGDKRYNDKLSDASEKAAMDDVEVSRKFLVRFEKIDTTGFPEQERLNQVLMVRQLKLGIEGAKFKEWREPVNQMSGIHLDAPQLVDLLAFDTVKDYEDYIARLKALPLAFDQTIDNMRLGMKEKLIPPKYLLEKVTKQSEQVGTTKPEESPFASPLKKFPKEFSQTDKDRLSAGVLAAIKDSVNPAYMKFTAFVRDEYAPKGRNNFGIWDTPMGAERYAYDVKISTTTNKTPDEIHQIGLKEVARIEGEMLKTANKLGFKDLKSFNESIEKNPDLHAHSRQQILDLYTKYINAMYEKIPSMLGRLPKGKVVVMQVPDYQEKESAGAFYNQGTPDGSRPGHVMVNTYDYEHRKVINIETTAFHEGIPGHHLQIAIAQELPTLPPFRQQGGNVAYAEGWALYSERLGEEVGFYQDPYSYYGHLQDEMLRAIRLVVDTGVHSKKWSRQQMVDFFHSHSGVDEVEVQSETDRYIVWPSQALGYKIGQLKILELREWAKKDLGSKFDLRGFHDTVLGAGALPLDVLEDQVHKWAASVKSGGNGSKVATN
jgi:uncharacterized protein (DUF885 family)